MEEKRILSMPQEIELNMNAKDLGEALHVDEKELKDALNIENMKDCKNITEAFCNVVENHPKIVYVMAMSFFWDFLHEQLALLLKDVLQEKSEETNE